jgi:glycosyltransferase involved in cell wall biosynthesis
MIAEYCEGGVIRRFVVINKLLRVCLDARLESGTLGGIEQAIIGLASGLSKLSDGNEEFLFLAFRGSDEWLRPYISGPCKIIHVSPSLFEQPRKRLTMPYSLAGRLWDRVKQFGGARFVSLPPSDGTIERLGIDLMHFTMQSAFVTDIPSIYQPWDLQHIHLPQFFSVRVRNVREARYRAFCAQANLVVVPSEWGKQDIMKHYGIPINKVSVIPAAPVLSAYRTPTSNQIEEFVNKNIVPKEFIFYPAQTFPHKNHIALLDALAILRDQYSIKISLISSGRRNSFFPTIQKHIDTLHLADQVRFLGFVDPVTLRCIYELCTCVVFPTKFEGWGLPLSEAFLSGKPVACSNIPPLIEQAGDAALYFDGDNPSEIASAIYKLWTQPSLRVMLAERGLKNVARFDWTNIARIYRAHYRRLAGVALTSDE